MNSWNKKNSLNILATVKIRPNENLYSPRNMVANIEMHTIQYEKITYLDNTSKIQLGLLFVSDL